MALLTPTNCTFDVYRGFNPMAPYTPPNTPGAYCGLSGVVKQHVRNGRFGYFGGIQANALLHWTTVLLVPMTSDLRDAYDSELNADTISNGDTILMDDYPIVGTCCAFVVVAVQRVDRGGPGDYLRVYLDRAQPNYGNACRNCSQAAAVTVPCCTNGWPTTLYATISVTSGSCDCVAGTFSLMWNGLTDYPAWLATTAGCGTGGNPVQLSFACNDDTSVIFGLGCEYNGGTVDMGSATTTEYSCPPSLSASFDGVTTTNNPCCDSVTLNVTVTQ